MGKTRILWVDDAKCIAIIFVILGHVVQYMTNIDSFDTSFVFRFIYSFHMPLFFVLSGYCSCKSIMGGVNLEGLKKRFIQLIIPFVTWGFVYKLTSLDQSYYIIFKTPDYGLWFLWVLFILYVSFFLVGSLLLKLRIRTPYACIFVLPLLWLAARFVTSSYGIGMAYSFSIYYFLGMILKEENSIAHKLFEKNNSILVCVIVFFLLVPFWYRTLSAMPEDMNQIVKGISTRSSYKLIVAILGSISIMGICRKIQDTIDNKLFQFIGQNTMGIYVTHQTIIWIIMHCLPESWTGLFQGYFMMLLLTIIVLLLSMTVMIIIKSNKFSSLLFMGDSTIF